MQVEQFGFSRITEHHINEKNNNESSNEITYQSGNLYSQQFKKLKHIPILKLGYMNIFIKKQNQKIFYKKELSTGIHQNFHDRFYQLRQKYEDQISKFIQKYRNTNQVSDQMELQNLKISQNNSNLTRNTSLQETINQIENKNLIFSPGKSKSSSKRQNEGGYFFNNWRSYESYYCTRDKNFGNLKESLMESLVYSILDMDYDMSLKIIDKINEVKGISYQFSKTSQNLNVSFNNTPKQIQINVKNQKKPKQINSRQKNNFQLTSLKIILKGLNTLFSIIKITDQINQNNQLSQTFFNRDQFNLLQDHYFNDPKAKINLFNITNLQDIQKSRYMKQQDLGTQAGYDQIAQKKKFDKKPSSNLAVSSPKNQPRQIMKSSQNIIGYRSGKKKGQESQQFKRFMQLASKYKKICILNNLMFLINFSKKIKIESCENDYFKLIFSFLKNGQDQLQNIGMSKVQHRRVKNQKELELDQKFSNLSVSSVVVAQNEINYKAEIDYMVLLLNLKGIKIYDRINFAIRLLSKEKKIKFVKQIQHKILKFPDLDNLLLFTKFYKQQLSKTNQQLNSFHFFKQQKPKIQQIPRNRKNSIQALNKYYTQHQFEKQRKVLKQSLQKSIQNKQQLGVKIKTICQNYIDQYGDLRTVAYLSAQYPCLSKYSEFFNQSLLLSYQNDEIQMLNSLKQRIHDQYKQRRAFEPKKKQSFLSQINFRQQKINQDVHQQHLQMNFRKCQICNLKVLNDKKQSFIECNKCKHGGHYDHMIKWYLNYQNCSNINCPCLCN